MSSTITKVQQSIEFYTTLFGFLLIMKLGQRCLLSNVSMILAFPTNSSSAGNPERPL